MFGKNSKESTNNEEIKAVKYKMDEETAKHELRKIDEFFDAEYGVDSEIIIEHIKKGMVYLDEDQDRVIYKLLSPIEQKNGEILTEIKLQALNLSDIMAIGRQLSMKGNSKEEFQISITYDLERTYTILKKSGNLPIGLLDRLKKKDLRVLSEVLDFLQ